jgi:hypothetical protein
MHLIHLLSSGQAGGCTGLLQVKESGTTTHRPTQLAPDARDSGGIPSLFLRLSIFPVGRGSASRSSAGNASPLGGFHH